MSDTLRARLFVLAAAILWSTAGAGIKNVSLGPWATAGGRALVAALFLALVLPEARRGFDRRVVLVAVFYALSTVSFVVANKYTRAANAIFLQDAAPLWILILSPIVLGERPGKGELVAAPFYVVGTLLFFKDELGADGTVGNVVALVSSVFFAGLILGLRALRGAGAEAAVLLGNVIGAAVTLPLAVRDGQVPTAKDVLLIVLLGAFQLGLAYVCLVRGLRRLPALETALLTLVEPVLNPVWAFLLAGERPGGWAIAGGAVILITTGVRSLTGAKE